jgi:hypothetical protein
MLFKRTQLLCYSWRNSTNNERRASCRTRDFFRREIKSLETKKMFHVFHFLQSYLVFGIINPFSWIFNAVSGEKGYPTSMHLPSGQYRFSRLLNSHWPIQISGAPAVCKVRVNRYKYRKLTFVESVIFKLTWALFRLTGALFRLPYCHYVISCFKHAL